MVKGLQQEMAGLASIIGNNVKEAEEATKEAEASLTNLAEISELVRRSTDEMGSVAAGNEEMAATIDDVAARVGKLSQSARGMAENVEASTTSEEIGLATLGHNGGAPSPSPLQAGDLQRAGERLGDGVRR